MRPSVLAALALACGTALVAPPARAQSTPRTMRLEVVHAPGADACPDAEAFRDAVDLSGGVDPFDDRAPARLVVTITGAGSLARGRWEMFDANGTKLRERAATVVGTCKQLVVELAMAFVVAYETPRAGHPEPPAPCPPTCDDDCRAKIREEVRREVTAEYRRPMDGVAVAIMAGGLMSAGLTAQPGGGFWLGGEVHGDWLSGSLEARVVFPAYVVTEPAKTRFEITSITAALAPCARWEVVMGCVFVDFGMFVAGVTTAPFAGPPVVATLGLGPRFAIRVPIGERFAVRAFGDLRFAPIASSYVAQDINTKWESGIVSGLFGLGGSFE